MTPEFNPSGSKYLREMRCLVNGRADVYAVLEAFNVTCPARQHAIKKLLCTGIRGKGDSSQDLREARDAVDRAMQMEAARQGQSGSRAQGVEAPLHAGSEAERRANRRPTA